MVGPCGTNFALESQNRYWPWVDNYGSCLHIRINVDCSMWGEGELQTKYCWISCKIFGATVIPDWLVGDRYPSHQPVRAVNYQTDISLSSAPEGWIGLVRYDGSSWLPSVNDLINDGGLWLFERDLSLYSTGSVMWTVLYSYLPKNHVTHMLIPKSIFNQTICGLKLLSYFHRRDLPNEFRNGSRTRAQSSR